MAACTAIGLAPEPKAGGTKARRKRKKEEEEGWARRERMPENAKGA